MSEPQKAAAPAAPAEQKVELNLLDQIVEEGRFGRETAAVERGKDLVKEFVVQVLQGEMAVSRDAEAMINARIAQIDHLLSIQLNEVLHHPQFQKLEGTWRGLKYLLDNSSMQFDAEDPRAERQQEGAAARSATGSRVRPERAVQEDLRRGIRHLRRRADCRAHRRLRIRPPSGGHGTAREDLPGGGGRARSVPLRRLGRTAQPGQLRQPGRSARPGEDLRQHRVRQVEVVPPERRLPLRGPHHAAHPDAPALRQGHQAHRGLQLRGRRGRNGLLPRSSFSTWTSSSWPSRMASEMRACDTGTPCAK